MRTNAFLDELMSTWAFLVSTWAFFCGALMRASAFFARIYVLPKLFLVN
jgi:hypothetical protein